MANNLKKRGLILCIDRDGVINIERKDYVKTWEEFVFKSDFLEFFPEISKRFETCVVVTNQRGVGLGFMSRMDVNNIHQNMICETSKIGAKIDAVYVATGKDLTDFKRKPNPGMVNDIKNDFPEFKCSNAIMIGNRASDMQFGRQAGMITVHYTNNGTEAKVDATLCDFVIASWADFDNLFQYF